MTSRKDSAGLDSAERLEGEFKELLVLTGTQQVSERAGDPDSPSGKAKAKLIQARNLYRL